ncbi:MAG: tripartite tricarboxylate transporter substrate binding protein [Pseudomonadota bacterium]
MRFAKSLLGGVAIAAAAIGMSAPAQALDMGCTTAKLIVPWKAGGGTHIIFSQMEKTIQEMDVPVKLQVVTVPGQGGNKGAKEARKAKADGCTLFAIHQSAIVGYLNGRVDFTWDGFDMVAQVTSTPEIMGAAGTVPFNSVEELVAAAKASPESIELGATFGSTSQFMWLLFEDLTGTKFKYIPFDGTKERVTALLADTIKLGTINIPTAKKHLATGDLKAMAIASDERSPLLPDLPTLKELGVDMTYSLDRGIVAPKGTPKEVIEYWADVVKKASENADFKSSLESKGTQIKYRNAEEYAEWFKAEYDAHEKVAIKVGMYKK